MFLILAACINYTNLSTALALKKSKEVGVRKTLGATRVELMRQMLVETFLLTGIVVGAAAFTAGFFLAPLNHFLDKQMPTSWVGWTSAGFLVALWVLVSMLSGIYPAFVLSGFNAVTALKSKVSTPKASMVFLRRSLVVLIVRPIRRGPFVHGLRLFPASPRRVSLLAHRSRKTVSIPVSTDGNFSNQNHRTFR